MTIYLIAAIMHFIHGHHNPFRLIYTEGSRALCCLITSGTRPCKKQQCTILECG